MSTDRKRGLGKGMSSLLSGFEPEEDVVQPVKTERKSVFKNVEQKEDSENVLFLPIERLVPNSDQPRKNFDAESLGELAASVKDQGIVQPLLVEEIGDGRYMIIAGERRYRAAEIAGLEKIPVIVRNYSETDRIKVSLVENIQRENLNPIEEASALRYLIEKSGMTQEEVAEKVGKSRAAVSNSIRLLVLPDEIKEDIIEGRISAGHARAILSCTNPSDRILLRDKIVNNSLSVRESEALAGEYNRGHKIIVGKAKKENPEILSVADKFVSALGAKCEIKGSLDRGSIRIKYRSVHDLERIYSLISDGGELFDE